MMGPNVRAQRGHSGGGGGAGAGGGVSSEEEPQFTDRSGLQLDMSPYDTSQKPAMPSHFRPEGYGNDELTVGTVKKKGDIGSLNEFVSEEELERLRREGEEKRKRILDRKKNKGKNKRMAYDPKKAIEESKKKSLPSARREGPIKSEKKSPPAPEPIPNQDE